MHAPAARAQNGVLHALLAPVDAAWLAALRVMFGLLLSVSMLRFVAYGWVDRFFVEPRFHFKYWGFSWVEPLPAAAMHGLFWALAGLSLLVAAGAMYRISSLLLAAGLTYIQLIDVTTYLNHYYLAALIAWLLAFTPAQRVWSIAAWRTPGLTTVPRGVLYLFRFQVGVVYVCAGLAKLQSDWLLHAQPLRIWLGSSVDLPVIGEMLRLPGVPLALSWAGFVFDSSIVLWLSLRRTRPYAYAVLLVFHAVTRLLFPIGMFPVIMSCAALVFFSPSWPRAVANLLRLQPLAVGRLPEADGGMGLSTLRRVGLGLGLGYCLVQLVLPLRFVAYGDNVLWHEQGMRFSWRVMVRAKGGDVTFVVREPSGRTFHVSPRTYLTGLQESEMSSQPDLVLQLAHHIARDFEQRGRGPVAVFADARVALNGRRSRPMIDPAVDLTTVQDGLTPASWILPAPQTPPPHTRAVR